MLKLMIPLKSENLFMKLIHLLLPLLEVLLLSKKPLNKNKLLLHNKMLLLNKLKRRLLNKNKLLLLKKMLLNNQLPLLKQLLSLEMKEELKCLKLDKSSLKD
jgi:hypothetical protein